LKAAGWGRLLRLSLAPSAAADSAAGLCLGAWGTLPERRESLLLPLAALCVYHGGMALNDWADRAVDARARPERPIPSGQVPAGGALGLALSLLVVGPALAASASLKVGLLMAGIAACAALYDLAGRGPWRGPLLLASCRGANLGCGVLLGGEIAREHGFAGAPPLAWAACALYAAYVLSVSRMARLEDAEDDRPLGRRPSRALLAAAACWMLLPAIAVLPWIDGSRASATTGSADAPTLATLAAVIPLCLAFALGVRALLVESSRQSWTRPLVGRATGMALRRLLVFTSTCALISFLATLRLRGVAAEAAAIAGWSGLAVAYAILLGYPISFALRRVFPPT
jgi:4-hydroxybenzoate polyprenyltransferase